jgi:hypothetical protein
MDQNQELQPLTRLQPLRIVHTAIYLLLVDHETPLAQIKRLELISLRSRDGAASSTLLFGLRHTLHVLEIGPHLLKTTRITVH